MRARLFACTRGVRRFGSSPCARSQSATTHVCVVGSGPAGFYTSKYLLQNPGVRVDLIDMLPTPFGAPAAVAYELLPRAPLLHRCDVARRRSPWSVCSA
jgi:hypothetical protein